MGLSDLLYQVVPLALGKIDGFPTLHRDPKNFIVASLVVVRVDALKNDVEAMCELRDTVV
jgi:hypothetical protein